MKIRVATYNIEHCAVHSTSKEEDKVDIKETASLIKKINADIVSLNEVYEDGNAQELKKQTFKIAKYAGYKYFYYAKGMRYDYGDEIGNAILSKYPIKDIKIVNVPSPKLENRKKDETEWFEDRVILKATIKAEKEFDVIITHFGLNNSEQELMVDALSKVLDESSNLIVMGDFNNEPNGKHLDFLYQKLKNVQKEVNNNDFTFASFNPWITLDYIFIDKKIKIESFDVVKEIVSDHFPVTAEIIL